MSSEKRAYFFNFRTLFISNLVEIVFLYKGEILESGSKEELLNKYNFDSLEKLYLHITNY